MATGNIIFGYVSIPVVFTHSRYTAHRELHLKEFIPTSVADQLFIEEGRLMGPTKDPQAFSLLAQTLARLNRCAVAVLDGETVIIRPFRGGLVLQFVTEVGDALTLEATTFQEQLAEQLVKEMTVKAFRGDHKPVKGPAPVIVDLTEALKCSVQDKAS